LPDIERSIMMMRMIDHGNTDDSKNVDDDENDDDD